MATVLDKAKQETKDAGERLERTSTEEHAPALEALSPTLFKSIKEGTLTVAEIDSFLQDHLRAPPKLKDYLLSKKAWLLLREGQGEQALHSYDEALESFPDSPFTWAMKGAALLELNQPEEAFSAFKKAYSLRDNFGPQKQAYLRDLFMSWSLASVFLGLCGIAEYDTDMAAKGVEECLSVIEKAEAENMSEAATVILEAGEQAEPGVAEDIEEWNLMVKLLSIKDPFEGWRALSKEISKLWPEGVSAVDAVREQRDREWNPSS
jgi:tetratricopeptide (TPR) repeat protein